MEIARALGFRGYEKRSTQWEYRLANTIPADHAGNTQIMPTFVVVPGNNTEVSPNAGARFAYPGFNDLLTLRDLNGNDEQVRVQWGYNGWCGLTATSAQTWNWDRPANGGVTDLRRVDSRLWTRALKFPSGEMPDQGLTKGQQNFTFGKKYDASGPVTLGMLDELVFWQFNRAPKDRPDHARLGAVPPEVANPGITQQAQQSGQTITPTAFTGIDEKTDEFDVHLAVYDSSGQVLLANGLPIDGNTFAAHGGVIKIDDELILYADFDTDRGHFSGCRRGAFGTDPASHEYEATVMPVFAFPASKVVAPIDTTSGSYELEDTTNFPDDGYLRFGLGGEVVGYTFWDTSRLAAPLGRLDSTTPGARPAAGATTTKSTAGSVFRARFGTTAEPAEVDDVAIAMPFRYYDRFAERADDAEMSYAQFSWTRHGAIWKRVTWDEEPRTNVQVLALVRFSDTVRWDTQKFIRVGQEEMPSDDRRQYLYEITDPKAINLLNVEADRVEVRLFVRYAAGAYDRFAPVAPDGWKQTPHVKKLVVEYVAPPQVLYQE
jgi:hypothetical protein